MSTKLRDELHELYAKCRCGDKQAFSTLRDIVYSSNSLSHEDHLVAKGYLGDLYLISDSCELFSQNRSLGLELLSEFACMENGNIDCRHIKHLLGIYHYECNNNFERAVTLIQEAANEEHVSSLTTLGYFYDYGVGVRQDQEKAFSLYMQSALLGYAVGECNVGKCYDTGLGCEKNQVQAFAWNLKAANKGLRDAQYNIGAFYLTGLGVDVCLEESAKWMELAANKGDSTAQRIMGRFYMDGNFFEQDFEIALHWFRRAADSGDLDSMLYLGKCFECGFGIEKNIVEAMRYFRRASRAGDERAHVMISPLLDDYKEEVWKNRKPFVLFLAGCSLLYEEESENKTNIIRDTLQIHDIQFEIMSFL